MLRAEQRRDAGGTLRPEWRHVYNNRDNGDFYILRGPEDRKHLSNSVGVDWVGAATG
jgi:hypothetical protein